MTDNASIPDIDAITYDNVSRTCRQSCFARRFVEQPENSVKAITEGPFICFRDFRLGIHSLKKKNYA